MKKLLILFLIFFTLNLYGLDLECYWELGEVKAGGIFKASDPKANFNFNASVAKFYFYDYDTGLNFSFSPLYYSFSINGPYNMTKSNYEASLLTIINTELAFNTLYKFAFANKYALNVFSNFHFIDPIETSRFEFNAGLEFAITSELKIFNGRANAPKAKLFSVRTGFRYSDKRPLFFIDIGMDLGEALFLITPNDPDDWKDSRSYPKKKTNPL